MQKSVNKNERFIKKDRKNKTNKYKRGGRFLKEPIMAKRLL